MFSVSKKNSQQFNFFSMAPNDFVREKGWGGGRLNYGRTPTMMKDAYKKSRTMPRQCVCVGGGGGGEGGRGKLKIPQISMTSLMDKPKYSSIVTRIVG